MKMDPFRESEKFYERCAEEYFQDTVLIDPESILKPLLKHLEPASTIFDIGCGSGRDLLWLKERGFQPTGLERSKKLAELARTHSGCKVIEADFQTYDFSRHQFNAVLSVGSLVHVDHMKMQSILSAILAALIPNGYFLLTLKSGTGHKKHQDGRIFSLWNSNLIENIFRKLNLSILDRTTQSSKMRHDDIWIGYLLERS